MGDVTITQYDENGRTEFHVVHHGLPVVGEWFKDWQKSNAIQYAQFLAGKY